MANRTITAANAVITLSVPDVFDAPFQLQGFMSEDAFDTDDAEPVQSRIGVDGIKSDGFVPFLTLQTFHFQADSETIDNFEIWLAQMKQAREVFRASGSMVIEAIGKQYDMVNGTMTRIKQTPDGKKVLEGQAFQITWGSVDMSFIS